MGNDLSVIDDTPSEGSRLLKGTSFKPVKNPSLLIAQRPKEFSGPEIKFEDIIITGKISEDEKSSYGAVMKGYCYGAQVAIKVLRGEQSTRARQLMEGFKEEVKIMSEVTHPHVCVHGSSRVSLGSGLAIAIEDWPEMYGTDVGMAQPSSVPVWSATPAGVLAPRCSSHWTAQPHRRTCVTVGLMDGTTLSCTPDHKLLTGDGTTWCQAGELAAGRDAVMRSLVAGVADTRSCWLTGSQRLSALAAGRVQAALQCAGAGCPAALQLVAGENGRWQEQGEQLQRDVYSVSAAASTTIAQVLRKGDMLAPTTPTCTLREYLATLAGLGCPEGTAARADSAAPFARDLWWQDEALLHASTETVARQICEVLGGRFGLDAVQRGTKVCAGSQRSAMQFVQDIGYRYHPCMTAGRQVWLSSLQSGCQNVGEFLDLCAAAGTPPVTWSSSLTLPVPIVEVVEMPGLQHVYDLSVPNEGGSEWASFVADGIVAHNCLFLGACFADEVMLVTELLEGDLIHLLNSPEGRRFSLFKRSMLARDVAMGLAWLHHINIVHLDLKPANVLFDSHGRLKVADFGLARIKSEDGYVPGACGGTPLYSAPEVLRKEDFTDKADIYSFGLIVWFILTGIEPYGQFSEWDSFFNAVAVQKLRPELPANCPKSLAEIITHCWAQDPAERPSLIRVLPALEFVLLDTGIGDQLGRALWKRFFYTGTSYGKTYVNKLYTEVFWEDFMGALVNLLHLDKGINLEGTPMILSNRPLGKTPTRQELTTATREVLAQYAMLSPAARKRVVAEERRRAITMGLECARVLLVNKDNLVTIERFGFVLRLFGPLESIVKNVSNSGVASHSDDGESDDEGTFEGSTSQSTSSSMSESMVLTSREVAAGETLLNSMANLMSQSWFHGEMNAAEAYVLLKDKRPGTFLVRFSEGQQSFVLSAVLHKSHRERLPMYSRPAPLTSTASERFNTRPKLQREASDPVLTTPRGLSTDDPNRRGHAHGLRTFSGAGELHRARNSSFASSPSQALIAAKEPEEALDIIVHQVVARDEVGRFMWSKSPHKYKSIIDLIESSERLTRPCSAPKTRFGYLFTPTRATHFGYLNPQEHRNPFEPAEGGGVPRAGGGSRSRRASKDKSGSGVEVKDSLMHSSPLPPLADVSSEGADEDDTKVDAEVAKAIVARSNLGAVQESPRHYESSNAIPRSKGSVIGMRGSEKDRLRRTSDPLGDEAADLLAEARAARRRRSGASSASRIVRRQVSEEGFEVDPAALAKSPPHNMKRISTSPPASDFFYNGSRNKRRGGSPSVIRSPTVPSLGDLETIDSMHSLSTSFDNITVSGKRSNRRYALRRAASLESHSMDKHVNLAIAAMARERVNSTSRVTPLPVGLFSPPHSARRSPRLRSFSPRGVAAQQHHRSKGSSIHSPEPSPRMRRKGGSSDEDALLPPPGEYHFPPREGRSGRSTTSTSRRKRHSKN